VRLGQRLEDEHPVVAAVEVKSGVGLFQRPAFTEPAVFLDRLVRVEELQRVGDSLLRQRGIEEFEVMEKMIRVGHRPNPPAATGEQGLEELPSLLELLGIGAEERFIG